MREIKRLRLMIVDGEMARSASTKSWVGGDSSSCSTKGKAADALVNDDWTSHQGVDGVLAFKN
jgi:hypothetical protein